ncbi:MAG: TetR/AcrR family transcriptional regulator [Actinomycetia bacterium]|nr:TetR/AcrR family transcriptional regulator [Actinomycetes bacterium]
MVDLADTEEPDESDEPADGRVARRERNRNAVLDVVLEMFGEDSMFPTIEQASRRSGLSLRSLYRYFADPGELVDSAIKRHQETTGGLFHLSAIGQGPLEHRIAEFVKMRIRGYEVVGAVYRASVHNAGRHQRVRDDLAMNRRRMREQFDKQFKPELAELRGQDREAVASAGDVLTQLDTIDLLRRDRRMTAVETERTLVTGLGAILHT